MTATALDFPLSGLDVVLGDIETTHMLMTSIVRGRPASNDQSAVDLVRWCGLWHVLQFLKISGSNRSSRRMSRVRRPPSMRASMH